MQFALLKDLSASTPVCALLIPLPEVTSLVNDICDGLEVHPCVCAGSAASDLHACFPNLPVLWKRHVYKLDNQQDKVCTKVYRGHPSHSSRNICSHGV